MPRTRRAWPTFQKPPDAATLWRWLERFVAEGDIAELGEGKKNDPFRFRLCDGSTELTG